MARVSVLRTAAAAAVAVAAVSAIALTDTATVDTGTCTRNATTGANVATELAATANGGTLCLGAGTYTFPQSTITKTSMTTVRAAAGVAVDSVSIALINVYSTRNIAFSGVSIKGAILGGDGDSPATDMRFTNVHWTSCVAVRQVDSTPLNIVFDGGTADLTSVTGGAANASPCIDDGRFYVRGYDGSYGTASGLVIKNMTFPGAHCTDGIEFVGQSSGWTVGPGNVFHGIKQNDPTACSTHVDPVQFYGAHDGKVVGNYFYDNTDGILSSNGNGDNMTIVDNVFGPNGDAYPYAIIDCGGNNQTYLHNDFLDDALYLCYADAGDPGDIGPTTNTLVRDNYMPGGFLWAGETACTGTTSDYNMHPTSTSGLCGGAHNFVGTATFSGGATPSTWAGFVLTSGSAGHAAAFDGFDIGIRASAGG